MRGKQVIILLKKAKQAFSYRGAPMKAPSCRILIAVIRTYIGGILKWLENF